MPDSLRNAPAVRFAALLLVCIAASAATVDAQRMRIGSSNPSGISAGPLFPDAIFAAGDTKIGVELWHYDVNGQTSLLLDVYKGGISSYPSEITRRPQSGNTWFVARSLSSSAAKLGRELHYYPSLPQSTQGGVILDLRPGAASSYPSQLTLLGSRLFFTANDGKSGRELWISDGTATGTKLVKDIVAGRGGSHPTGLTVFRGKLFFAASGSAGTELWMSDGTATGTVLVKDIRSGAASSTPEDFTEFDSKLYFAATTDATGRELWCTDGTAAGTVLVEDIRTGKESSAPCQLTAGLGLAFTAWTPLHQRQLYIRSRAGTLARVTGITRSGSIAEVTAFGTTFCFRANTAAAGSEVWQTTATGSKLLHDVRSGSTGSFPSNLTTLGGVLYFRANDGVSGVEYWRSDGSKAALIRDIRDKACDSWPSRLVPVASSGAAKFLFAAKGNRNGVELWTTNGVTASLARDIDDAKVLPGLHWASGDKFTTISIKDGTAQQPGALLIGSDVTKPQTYPFLRGALSVDLNKPLFCLVFTTGNTGEATLTVANPPVLNTPSSIVSQVAVQTTPASIDISVPGSCNHGSLEVRPPNGPKARGKICLDDETGEYEIEAKRTDTNSCDGYVAVYQMGAEGDCELLRCIPIQAGETVRSSGRIDMQLPLITEDMPGRHIEMHLLEEPPTSAPPARTSLVTTSYC